MSLSEDIRTPANDLGAEEATNRRTYSTGAYAKTTILKSLERRLSIQSISRRFSKDSEAIDTGLRLELQIGVTLTLLLLRFFSLNVGCYRD